MDRQGLVIAGVVVSIIGALTLFMKWFEIYYEDYHTILTFSYSGWNLLTSSDFNDPNGLFYQAGVGFLGRVTPLLVAIAFMAMLARFLAKVDRPYFSDVRASAILIIIACLYFMVWSSDVWNEIDYYEEHSFGGGPIIALIMAIAGMVLAKNLDNKIQYPNAYSQGASYSDGFNGTTQSTFAFYCPHCGKGITQEELDSTKFCSNCGSLIEHYIERNDET